MRPQWPVGELISSWDPGVAELGGLVVVGTERMMNQRIDLQIRGRSGRQGDPGLTKFFVSLEDDLMKNWGQTGSRIPIKTMMWMSGLVQPKL